ncbi:MAG: hypothetical protein IK139_02650, partial [Lachnospiraceae bacterium]|nr:hypothetical protein [Lachnospiraceae bacterium]
AIAKHFLTDFDEAEKIKFGVNTKGAIEFTDIMNIHHKTDSKEVQEILRPTASIIAREVSDQIKKLNGGKPVSAIFVVGGGGKVPVFTEILADEMQIARERVAVKGEEVLKNIDFKDERVKKDSLLVTPIGICLNYFNQVNNFIFVSFNDSQIKLYDNDHLQIVDAAMASGFSNADLFPKRGKEINYTVNGSKRLVRGTMGEGAVIRLNGENAPINAKIKAGDIIEVEPSTAGDPAVITIDSLPEFKQSIKINVNDKTVAMPKFAEVNGQLQSGYYEIQDGDEVVMRDYYTVAQILDFMDISKEDDSEIYVNHEEAYSDMPVYENFNVEIEIKEEELVGDTTQNGTGDVSASRSEGAGDDPAGSAAEEAKTDAVKTEAGAASDSVDAKKTKDAAEKPDTAGKADELSETIKAGSKEDPSDEIKDGPDEKASDDAKDAAAEEKNAGEELQPKVKGEALKPDKAVGTKVSGGVEKADGTIEMSVRVNGEDILLTGKKEYIYVDVFDKIDFDLSTPRGKAVITKLNGMKTSSFAEKLRPGDILDIYWSK